MLRPLKIHPHSADFAVVIVGSAMYQATRLPNGITVLTAPMPHMASVCVGLWVAVGGRFEPTPLNGISHFIEHMLFKGTARRSALEISQAVEGLGGYLNAFTEEENTCFYAKARHDRLPELLDVLEEMLLDSLFDPKEIRKEREVIKEELAAYLDQPAQHVQDLLNATMWPNHPLGRPLTGTGESLDRISRAELVQFHRQNYVAPATLIVAAGAVEHQTLVRLVQKSSKRFAAGRRPTFIPWQDAQTGARVALHRQDTTQAQLALGLRVCSRHHEDRFALRVLNTILGENMSSRLFQILREDTGLAYSIHSQLGFFDDVGLLSVSAGVEVDEVGRALKLIIAEFRRLREKAPSGAELRRAHDYLKGQIDLHLEGTENQMTWLGEQWMAFGRLVSGAEVQQQLREVTAGQVRAVARKYLCTERMSLAVVSPLSKNPGFDRYLTI